MDKLSEEPLKLAYTIKPVLRDHPRETKKWLLKTGSPLLQVHLHYILIQGEQKGGC